MLPLLVVDLGMFHIQKLLGTIHRHSQLVNVECVPDLLLQISPKIDPMRSMYSLEGHIRQRKMDWYWSTNIYFPLSPLLIILVDRIIQNH